MKTPSTVLLDDTFGSIKVCRDALGFIPELIRAQTLLPRAICAQTKLESATRFKNGSVTRVQKERILLIVALSRENSYGTAEHCAVLASLGEELRPIEELLVGFRGMDLMPQETASLEFCRKLTCDPHGICLDDIEILRACGLSDDSIFETIVATALGVYRCTLSAGLISAADLPLTKALAPQTRSHSQQVSAIAHANSTHRKKGPYLSAPYLCPSKFAPFATFLEKQGFIPNFFRAQTLQPDVVQAEIEAMEQIVMSEDLLTRVQKESILLAVSAANLNSYCVAMHSNMLRGMGVSAEEGDQIAVDHHFAALSDADKGLIDFALKLGTKPSELSAEDVAKLRAAGFTEAQSLECIVVTAFNNFANYLQMGLGIEPDFEPPSALNEKVVKLFPASNSPIPGDSAIPTLTTVTADADEMVVARAQAGDLEAFEELVRSHTQFVYRILTAILGDPTEAQDAMQDVFLSAFKHIGSFEGRSKVSTWLASIARNAAFQRIRGRKNLESLDTPGTGEDTDFRPRQIRAWQDDPEQSYSKEQIRQLVEKGILQLSATYSAVVMLRDIEQLSADEVARRLGLSVPTVKTRLFRGRLMLREWLSPYFLKSTKGTSE